MTESIRDQEDVTAGTVESWVDSQDHTPLSSGRAANTTKGALATGGTLAQIAAARLRPGTDLFDFALERTLDAHRRAGGRAREVPVEDIKNRLPDAFSISRCVGVMAVIGAATGQQYNRQDIVYIDPSDRNFQAAEYILSTPDGRNRVVSDIDIAAKAVTTEDPAYTLPLHQEYQNALLDQPSERFPANTMDREVQRSQLMVHVEARLRAGFARAGRSGPEVDALINNLLADTPTESVFIN